MRCIPALMEGDTADPRRVRQLSFPPRLNHESFTRADD
jgi:hypothetical protein